MIKINRYVFSIIAASMIGISVGIVWVAVFAPKLCDCKILYVAQDELMELEQARVESAELADRQLFYGDIEAAISLATTLPEAYQNQTTQVVYSMSAITGKNVKSISKQVHSLIIKTLENQKVSS